jgi:O-antigen ligase
MIINLRYTSHSLAHGSVYVWMVFYFIPLLIFLHIRLCCLNVVLLSAIPVELLRLKLVAVDTVLVIELLLVPHQVLIGTVAQNRLIS